MDALATTAAASAAAALSVVPLIRRSVATPGAKSAPLPSPKGGEDGGLDLEGSSSPGGFLTPGFNPDEVGRLRVRVEGAEEGPGS